MEDDSPLFVHQKKKKGKEIELCVVNKVEMDCGWDWLDVIDSMSLNWKPKRSYGMRMS